MEVGEHSCQGVQDNAVERENKLKDLWFASGMDYLFKNVSSKTSGKIVWRHDLARVRHINGDL